MASMIRRFGQTIYVLFGIIFGYRGLKPPYFHASEPTAPHPWNVALGHLCFVAFAILCFWLAVRIGRRARKV